MRNLILFVILAATFVLKGHDTTSAPRKIRFGGLQQFGIAASEHSTNSLFSVINGIRYKRMFIGIGADVQPRTYYPAVNTSAVFLDGRYYAGRKKQFFGRIDGGVNVVRLARMQSYDFATYSRDPGYYGAVGIGVKAKLGREVYYTIDLCYVLKQSQYTYSYRAWGWRGEVQTERLDIRQSMIQLNMGLEIF
jgi:hypothetical protein